MFNIFLRIFLFFLVVQPFSVHPRILRSTSVQSQHLFQNPEDIQKGNETIAISEAKTYLKAFGYLELEDKADFNNKLLKADDDEFDEELETAIKKFQEYYHLNVSGKLDSETIKLMSLPRCGVPDHHHGTNIIGNSNVKVKLTSKYAYFEGNYKWPNSKRNLTYIFASGVEVYPLEVLRNVFKEAFEQWSNVTSFTFNETAKGEVNPDLIIGFFRGDHGDGAPFQRFGLELGHAFLPTDGRLHLNADQPWSTQVPIPHGYYDLVWVAMHEIGHLLGLDHSSHRSAVMYPFAHRGVNRRALSTDDIAGIRSLYSLPGIAYSSALHCDYHLMMFTFACSLIIFLFL